MADNWGEPTNGDGGDGRARTPSPSAGRARSPPPRQDDDRGRAPSGQAQNPGNNLHVSGLSSRVEEQHLEEAFSRYGSVSKVQVMRDPHTRDPRGFAFVTMVNPEDAQAAIEGLNSTELQGKVISIEKARRGRARTPTPGAYHGPPKREPYGGRDSRYDDRDRYYDRRGGHDDRDRRYDDRERRDDRYGSYAAPMRGGDDRDRGGRSSYDDRRSGYDDRRSSRYNDYDERRGGSRY